ncbi:unnamed protein product [Moneuplotes crassus]|uniref:Lipid-binding serum glycoprotein N-terminal domain-containing protein n=1 Tax=Euplotes crassus TaxID=5936 RepID=A0AAD1UJS5_EUPCR|nr:unnamed protein product [Moneuplotes crassus]
MNKHLILILLVPLLVLAEDYDIVKVGMNAKYTKKALQQFLVYPPLNINIDKADDRKLLMSTTNIMMDSPHPDDIEFDFDQEDELITVKIKNQHFNFSSLITFKKAFFTFNGNAQSAGIIDEIYLTFDLTTQKGQYTNTPVVDITEIDFDFNYKDLKLSLSSKILNTLLTPIKGLLKKSIKKSLFKIIRYRLEKSIFQQMNEELTRVSGRFMIDDGVLVDLDALDGICIKDDTLILPYEVTYYLPKGLNTTEQVEEECGSDCGHEEHSEIETEQESEETEETEEDEFKFFLVDQCVENNKLIKFCFGRSNEEQQVEELDDNFTRTKKYFLTTLTSIYNDSAIGFENEE